MLAIQMYQREAVVNCVLGKNFTSIIYISGNGGAGECGAFSRLHWRDPPIVVELGALPKATALASPCACGLAW